MQRCETCNDARHSPSGKVACALLNNIERVAALAGQNHELGLDALESDGGMLLAIEQIIPKGVTVYQGWAYFGRRFGKEESISLGEGALTNNAFLLDKDSCCPHWNKEIR